MTPDLLTRGKVVEPPAVGAVDEHSFSVRRDRQSAGFPRDVDGARQPAGAGVPNDDPAPVGDRLGVVVGPLEHPAQGELPVGRDGGMPDLAHTVRERLELAVEVAAIPEVEDPRGVEIRVVPLGHGRPVPRRSARVCGHVQVHRAHHAAGAGQVEGDRRPVSTGAPEQAASRPAELDAEELAAVSLEGPREAQRPGIEDVHELVARDGDLAPSGEERHLLDLAVHPLSLAERSPPRITELEVRRPRAVLCDRGRDDSRAGVVDSQDRPALESLASGAEIEYTGP